MADKDNKGRLKKGKAVKKSKPLEADGDPAEDSAERREEQAGEAEDGGEDRRAATEHDYDEDSRAAKAAGDRKERRAAQIAEDEEDEDEYDEDEKDQNDEENVVKFEQNKPEGEDG